MRENTGLSPTDGGWYHLRSLVFKLPQFGISSVRFRLTLLHVAVLAVSQIILCFTIFKVLQWNYHKVTDSILSSQVDQTITMLSQSRNHEGVLKPLTDETLAKNVHGVSSFFVYDAQGKIIATRSSVDNPLPAGWQNAALTDFHYTFSDVHLGKASLQRADYRRVLFPNDRMTYLVVVSRPIDRFMLQSAMLKHSFLVSVPVCLLLSGLGSWLLYGRTLAPVEAMSQRAMRISADNMSERLSVAHPNDELGQLATALNELLDRLSSAFAQQKEFIAEATHQLQTPVAVILTATNVTLHHSETTEPGFRETLSVVHDQAAYMRRVIDSLLRLARAEAGFHDLDKSDVYMSELVMDAMRDVMPLAASKHISIDLARTEDISVYGDSTLLMQLISNLIENAVKYTPRNGRVTLDLHCEDGLAVLAVEDSGCGIPAELHDRVFDRFFRVPTTHRPNASLTDGSGLGLTIARWIAQQHGGTLRIRSSVEGEGSTFVLSLPIEISHANCMQSSVAIET